MTVTNTKYKDLVATDAVAVTFPFTFKCTNPNWVECFLATVPATKPVEVTNFTVALHPDQEVQAGGTVTFAAAPATGTLAIVRGVALTQLVNYMPFGPFPSEAHEGAMDKLTYQQQLTLGERTRVLQYGYVTDFEGPVDIVLEPFNQVDEFLYWKEDGSIGSALLLDFGIVDKTYVDNADLVLQNQINLIEPRVTQNEVDIASNDVELADHEARITSNTGRITQNEADIASNDTELADHETRISSNTGRIAQNEADIASNDVDIAALQTDKVDKTVQVISDDSEIVEVVNPSLADNVNLVIKTNIPNATIKLDEFGLVPQGNLPPTGGLKIFGLWDASSGNNPTDTRPDALPYQSGDTYITSLAGTIPLIDPDTGLEVPTPLIQGDLIIYVQNYDATVKGWVKGANVDTGSVVAGSVVFTPYQGIVEDNVQDGMQGLEDRKFDKTGGAVSGPMTVEGLDVKASIDTNTAGIAANLLSIQGNASRLTATEGATATNASGIADNVSRLTATEAATATNATGIAANLASIQSHASRLTSTEALTATNSAKPYVTSSGSNANGSYRVWSDGLRECWHVTPSISGLGTWTYPVPFAGIPTILLTGYLDSNTTKAAWVRIPTVGSTTLYTNSPCQVFCYAKGY